MTTTDLKFPTKRLELPRLPGRNLHLFDVGPGIKLGYRPGKGAWIALIAKDGQQVPRKLGIADDVMPADGVTVLTFGQARDAAIKRQAEFNGAVVTAAKTIDEALSAYRLDLQDRGKRPYNAELPRYHLPAELLVRRLDAVTVNALKAWRDGLRKGGMKAATLNRTLKPLIAAFNLAAKFDPRIAANRDAWEVGLEMMPNATVARNAVLSDVEVRAIVAAAYELDQAFGLYVQVHAEVGARSSQIARITVGDLQGDRLIVPSSHKGGGKLKIDRAPIPVRITPALAAALTAAAGGRPAHEPLLLKKDGTSWQEGDSHRRLFNVAVLRAVINTKCEPNTPLCYATIYALRHSSIVRALLANRPIAFVAKVHDTSVPEIERHYGRFIANHYDGEPLLDTTPGANVVPIRSEVS